MTAKRVARLELRGLTYPPTANTYWRTWRGRMLLSAKGRDYKATIAREFADRGGGRVDGRLRVHVHLEPPDERRRDLDNALKPTLDALKDAGAFVDDCQIDDLRVTRGAVTPGGACHVEVEEVRP